MAASPRRIAAYGAAIAGAALLLFAASVWLPTVADERKLAVRWEGAVNDRNLRDLGKSLNECLGEPAFAEGHVLRSAVWFSGWSCASAGDPDVILSLNYDPRDGERYFCRRSGESLVGLVSGAERELNDLEFLETWSDETMRASACWYFREGLTQIGAGKRLLVHCDAGRDRTGTYAAVVAGLAAESAGRLDTQMLTAIECDYRKTRSLTAAKDGRMRHFLEALMAQGGVAQFLERTCGLDRQLIDSASRTFWAKGSEGL